ncbi:BPSL0761 family protein, partial [Pseudomonas aeruginosa]
MTLPYERTRSVVQAQEFLVELSRDTNLSESIRDEARRLLSNYPSKADMLQAGR